MSILIFDYLAHSEKAWWYFPVNKYRELLLIAGITEYMFCAGHSAKCFTHIAKKLYFGVSLTSKLISFPDLLLPLWSQRSGQVECHFQKEDTTLQCSFQTKKSSKEPV